MFSLAFSLLHDQAVKTILLIDDNHNFLETLADWLREGRGGLNVLTAENGMQGAKIIDTCDVDLLVTDLNMPVMDGYQLLTYLREKRPSMPVIVMTADVNSDLEARLRSLGVKQCLNKSVLLPEMGRTLSNWLA